MSAVVAIEAPASAARQPAPAAEAKGPFDRLKFVMFNITPYAPGVAHDAPLSHPNRCLECWAASPVQALRRLLDRLERRADHIEARAQVRGDTVLLGKVNGITVPLAFVGEEMPTSLVVEGLAHLRAGRFG